MELKSCLTKAVQGFFLLWAGVLLVYSLSLSVKAQTANVSATVTVQNVAVSVTDGSVAYGTISAGSTANTVSGQTQTITNDGNVSEDFAIQDSSSNSWTLSGDTAPSGPDTYGHAFSTDTGTNWTAINDSTYTTVATGIGASATQNMDLQIYAPDSSTTYDEQSITLTVQATAN